MDNLEREFENVMKLHRNTIYTVCYMFSKDADEVAEMFQEISINIWRGFTDFRGDSNIKSWIWRVCLNTCITAERKKQRQIKEKIAWKIKSAAESCAGSDSRQLRMLRERINMLDLFDRAIVLLWLENLSYEEIALLMGISVKNVSVRLVRIREKIKKLSNG